MKDGFHMPTPYPYATGPHTFPQFQKLKYNGTVDISKTLFTGLHRKG